MTPVFENYLLILTPEGQNDPQFFKTSKTLLARLIFARYFYLLFRTDVGFFTKSLAHSFLLQGTSDHVILY